MEPEGMRHEALSATPAVIAAGPGRKPVGSAPRRRVSLDFLPPSAGGGGGGEGGGGVGRKSASTVMSEIVDCPGFPQTGYTSQKLTRPASSYNQVDAETAAAAIATATSPLPRTQPQRRRSSLTHAPSSASSFSSHVPGHRPPPPIAARNLTARRIQSFDEYSSASGMSTAHARRSGVTSPSGHATALPTAGASAVSSRMLHNPGGRRRMHRRASADLIVTGSTGGLSESMITTPHRHLHRNPRQGSRSLMQRRNSASIRSANEAAMAAAAASTSVEAGAANVSTSNNSTGSTSMQVEDAFFAASPRLLVSASSFHEDTTTATPTSFLDYEFDDPPLSNHSGAGGGGFGGDGFGGDDAGRTDPASRNTAVDFPSPWEDDPFLTESPRHGSKPKWTGHHHHPHPRLPNQHSVAAAGAVAAAAATTLNTRGGGGGGGGGALPSAFGTGFTDATTAMAVPSPLAVTRGTIQGRTSAVAHQRRFSEGPGGTGGGATHAAAAAAARPMSGSHGAGADGVISPRRIEAPSSSSSSVSPPTTGTGNAARVNRFRRANSFQPGARVERNSRRSLSRGRSSSGSSVSVGRYSGSSTSRSPSPATYRRMLDGTQPPPPRAPVQCEGGAAGTTKTPRTPQARGSSSRSLAIEGASPIIVGSLTKTPSQRSRLPDGSVPLSASPSPGSASASPATKARPRRVGGGSGSRSSDESSGGDSPPVLKRTPSVQAKSPTSASKMDAAFTASSPWGDETANGNEPASFGHFPGSSGASFAAAAATDAPAPASKKSAKRSGRRASTSALSSMSASGVIASAAPSVTRPPLVKPTSAAIPYPATPSTVASGDSFSTRQSSSALMSPPKSSSSSPTTAAEPFEPSFTSSSGPLAVAPSGGSTPRTSLSTLHKMHRRASTSNATSDSQSVRSSLTRLRHNQQQQQQQQQPQRQQRRMSSSSTLVASAVQW